MRTVGAQRGVDGRVEHRAVAAAVERNDPHGLLSDYRIVVERDNELFCRRNPSGTRGAVPRPGRAGAPRRNPDPASSAGTTISATTDPVAYDAVSRWRGLPSFGAVSSRNTAKTPGRAVIGRPDAGGILRRRQVAPRPFDSRRSGRSPLFPVPGPAWMRMVASRRSTQTHRPHAHRPVTDARAPAALRPRAIHRRAR